MTSLTARVALLCLALVSATGGVVGYVVLRSSYAALVAQELSNLSAEARVQALRLERGIDGLREDVAFLAATPPIQGIARARQNGGVDPLDDSTELLWRQRLSIIFTELLRAKPSYQMARYIGLDGGGRELVRVERSAEGIVVVDQPQLQRKGNASYFREAMLLEPGEVYLSEVTLSREFGRVVEPAMPVIRASIPIYAEGGARVGVVVLNRRFAPTLDALAASLPEVITPYVMNDRGDYLLHPAPGRAFAFEWGEIHRIQEAFPDVSSLFAPTNSDLELSLSWDTGPDPLALHLIKVPLDSSPSGRFLGIALAVSFADVAAQATAVRDRAIALSLVVVVAIAMAALVFSRLITRRLLLLTRAAAQVAEGDYEVTLPAGGRDEIALLAGAFRAMVDRVEERERAIEESEARTRAMIADAPHAMLTIDRAGTIREFNGAAAALFGYAVEDIIGQNVSALMDSGMAEMHSLHIERAARERERGVIHIGRRREILARHRDGSPLPIEITIRPLTVAGRLLFTGWVRPVDSPHRSAQDG